MWLTCGCWAHGLGQNWTCGFVGAFTLVRGPGGVAPALHRSSPVLATAWTHTTASPRATLNRATAGFSGSCLNQSLRLASLHCLFRASLRERYSGRFRAPRSVCVLDVCCAVCDREWCTCAVRTLFVWALLLMS